MELSSKVLGSRMKSLRPFLCALALIGFAPMVASAQNTRPKTTYLWHLHQPIYWNDQKSPSEDRYEYARESIDAKNGGRPYPLNDLNEIFSKDDRVAAYQYRPASSVFSMSGGSRAGAQLTYSGALMENVGSLGSAAYYGYGGGWWHGMRDGFNAKTPSGHPRLDSVNFSFHHALLPLQDPETVYMEIRLHQEKMKEILGGGYTVSKGIFPTEMAFSTRLIPALKRAGVEWSIVSGEHIARACPDFPLVFGSGGVNCDPPNRADQINVPGVEFIRRQISRGCGPTQANPLSYQVNRAKYVDPSTGAVEEILVVPSDQASSWDDGYGCFSPGFLGALTARNNPANPSFAVLAHDGDNAFGGGFSYYLECVPNYTSTSVSNNFDMTTVQQFLSDFPGARDLVHVEDGAWVNADSDFGSPTYINWMYPLLNASGQHDPVNGWHEDAREYAIWTAALNRIMTAQAISGHSPNFTKILHPDGSTHPVDRAWHYFLGSLDSGNQYYGDALDFEVKGTLGANEAVEHTDPVIGAGVGETTPPTIWTPQRQPYNPGSVNFGVQYQYSQHINNGDFHIWTFIYDVAGPVTAVLKYREDVDGANPLATDQNETFAGGPEVGSWQTLPMNRRAYPATNIYNKPGLNYFELPQYIADHYSVAVTGLRSKLIDYYIEATDANGNVSRSAIQHVWIGDGSGSTPGGGERVAILPDPAEAGESLTVTYTATGGPLASASQVRIHHGHNNWTAVSSPDPVMSATGTPGEWEYTYTVPEDASTIEMVFNNGSGTWDNNNGQDWRYTTTGPTGPGGGEETAATSPWTMDGAIDGDACDRGAGLYYGEKQGWVYLATDLAAPADAFLYVSSNPTGLGPMNWAKAGQVAAYNLFLAREGTNTFAGWFDTSALLAADSSKRAFARNGNVLEGAVRKDLLAANGPLHIALGTFATADGGALIAQSPESTNADGNIDASEFLPVYNGPNPTGTIAFTPSETQIALSWTAPTNAPTGYLVLRSVGSTPPADVPINGNMYSVGTVIGSSTVVHAGAAPSIIDTGATGGTYAYAVYSFNASPGGCVTYRIASPLTGSSTTTSVESWDLFGK